VVLRVRHATVLPVVVDSNSFIDLARDRLVREVGALIAEGVRVEHPERHFASINFHLAYHGRNDRPVQELLGRLYLGASPELAWESPHLSRYRGPGSRIRVGFISRFLHGHSIGKTSRGVIARLRREDFEVITLHAPPATDDAMGRGIRASADSHVDLPQDMQAAREMIAALGLDVLYYQDIGMDAYTYFLAFSRLAPVQCVSFGHPDTTGIPNMDWWVSSANFEPVDFSDHYSEKVWLAQDVGTLAYYHRPAEAAARSVPQPHARG